MGKNKDSRHVASALDAGTLRGLKSSASEKKLRGAPGFEEYYSLIYGARWPSLKEALLKEGAPKPFKCHPNAPEYFLDPASVLAALSLPLEGSKNILDMCAAPGGKSLVLASLMEDGAFLRCNERSFERTKRLERVVQEHLSEERRERVKISCGDGALLCKKESQSYDAILLDAPCSSERHVLTSPKYLDEWSPARVKSLAMQQWALLSCAFRLLNEGGFLLYSTCALNPSENSGLCERLLKKFPNAKLVGEDVVRAFQSSQKEALKPFFDVSFLPGFEAQETGFSILPDAQNGFGPIFFCLFKKSAL